MLKIQGKRPHYSAPACPGKHRKSKTMKRLEKEDIKTSTDTESSTIKDRWAGTSSWPGTRLDRSEKSTSIL